MTGSTPTTTDQDGASPYTGLRQKVRDLLIAHGGSLIEDQLIGKVFGALGSPGVWRSLLRSALERTDDGLVFDYLPNGAWALPREPSAATPDTALDNLTCVIFDAETTGLKPAGQRIIELAAIRVVARRQDGIFSTLLQPGCPLTAQITRLTGITDDLLEDAPAFADIAHDLLAFLGDDLIIGHNVGFDIAFLDAELRRLGLPTLLNNRLDTLALAQHILPGQRRWSLDAVARSLGVPVPVRRHRADIDARLTAAAFDALLQRAPARGMQTLDDLFRVAGARGAGFSGADEHGAIDRGRMVMNQSWLEEIPHAPGCYLMRDERDTVIYVGKAKNLNNRVRSYYSQHLGETRKPGLLEAIRRIETIVVGSELEALLLEIQLIRRYTPQYNVQGRHVEHYPYIKLDLTDSWPRVFATRRRLSDGARYFGPFRNPRAVRRALDTLAEVLPLRTCRPRVRDPEKRWPSCLRLHLGQCLGPCVGQTTPEEYGAVVRDLIRFLEGDAWAIVDRIQAERSSLQHRGYSAKAAQLEAAQRHLTAIAYEGGLLTAAEERRDCVVVLASAEPEMIEVLLLARGRLWARTRVDRQEAPAEVADRLHRSWQRAYQAEPSPIDHETVDETALIINWLRRHDGSPAILNLPENDLPATWQALAISILQATPAFAVWESTEALEDSISDDEDGDWADLSVAEDDA